MHGCIGDIRGGNTRARNILQHGLQWMEEDERLPGYLNERGKKMLQRLIDMKKGAGDVVGYSLDN